MIGSTVEHYKIVASLGKGGMGEVYLAEDARLHDPPASDDSLTEAPTATLETGEGKILGTVAHMSPEQAEGKPVDSRSDVYSLGIVLYEMATGERPFQGDTKMSTIGSILKDEPAAVSEVNKSLPRHLSRIVRRYLAKDPNRRYQTALDLRNELEEFKADIDSGKLVADSRAAAGKAWLAYLYAEEHHHRWNERPEEYDALDRALKLAEEAVQIDDASHVSHGALMLTHFLRGELIERHALSPALAGHLVDGLEKAGLALTSIER